MSQFAVLKCRFNFPQMVINTMRSLRNGSLILPIKFLTAFFTISLLYHFLTAFIIPDPIQWPIYPVGSAREFYAHYLSLHSQLAPATISGALLGAILGIEITILVTRPWRPPRPAKLRWILIGCLLGAGIGTFLRSFQIRWNLCLIPYRFFSEGGFLDPILPRFSFYIDKAYFFWLATLIMLALLLSISTKSKSTTSATYRFGCRY